MTNSGFLHNKRLLFSLIAIVIIAGLLIGVVGRIQAYSVPVTSIIAVSPGVSVTLAGNNFPAGQNFTVRMGYYGSYGLNGTVVGSYTPNTNGYFTNTFAIPSSLAGLDRIAIRLDSTSGFYSYNWFYNVAAGSAATAAPVSATPVPVYSGYPTIDIASVSAGTSVTVNTHNMPPGQAFTVRMGEYGTLGIGGIVVGTTTNSGGSYSATFAIPPALAGRQLIAIRMDSPSGYYYAFDWFKNVSGGSTSATAVPSSSSGYNGTSVILITGVAKGVAVSFNAVNLPANTTFTIKMGSYDSYGVGGTVVGSYTTNSSGSFSSTFAIPSGLTGASQIAIRLEANNGSAAYSNWFNNK